MGFSKANKNIFIFRYYGTELKDGKMTCSEKVPQQVKQKIHRYITYCLREDLKEKLDKVKLEELKLEDKKEKPKTQQADDSQEQAAAVVELEVDQQETANRERDR